MPAHPAPRPTIRQRYRAQVRHEVKQAALGQLEQAGPAGLSVSAIGKQLGVFGPAPYRYFAGRDELLTELIIDACEDLARALRVAAEQHQGMPPRARFETLAALTGHGHSPSRTGTGSCSDRRCQATTPPRSGLWAHPRPRWASSSPC